MRPRDLKTFLRCVGVPQIVIFVNITRRRNQNLRKLIRTSPHSNDCILYRILYRTNILTIYYFENSLYTNIKEDWFTNLFRRFHQFRFKNIFSWKSTNLRFSFSFEHIEFDIRISLTKTRKIVFLTDFFDLNDQNEVISSDFHADFCLHNFFMFSNITLFKYHMFLNHVL